MRNKRLIISLGKEELPMKLDSPKKTRKLY